ncbi:WD40 repeat domain-containing protein [Streptomyces sp. Isolate_45]|uniref:WD40 repeat domain-containing protein n=1 Tax=Streptomyces sp. Isolate_45 TaxID=2950111 RepID=UPI002481B6E5|nr:WD40 repeat domain-containing protein [Streptomyces sp. Isolate_45]MDA5283697.1 WD40 repeat domain-containing protein [Streptomyces sp. Isolate_45]
MIDSTDAGQGVDTFKAALAEQARHLRRLKVERGNPSLRRIALRAERISSGTELPIATQSTAFAGTRFAGVDKIILLVRTLMSWDADGEEIPAPARTDPVLDEWRNRWRATAELRPGRRNGAAPAPAPREGDPTLAREVLAGPTAAGVPRQGGPPPRPGSSLAVRALLHAARAGALALPPLRTGVVFSVAFSPDGSLLATATVHPSGSTVRLWDPVTRTLVRGSVTDHQTPGFAVAFSPDGSLLASTDLEGMVRLWDPVTCTPVGEPLTGHTEFVRGLAFSPDGSLLASGDSDGMVRLWDPVTCTPVGDPFAGLDGMANSLEFSPDGSLLAIAGADDGMRLWDPVTRTPVGDPLTGHDGEAVAAFSPDGSLLATAGVDGMVRLWDPVTRTLVGDPFADHDGEVVAVAFSPDGSLLATAGAEDGMVRLWDPVTRAPVGEPLATRHNAAVTVAFSPDGSLLAAASFDKRIFEPEDNPEIDKDAIEELGVVQLWVVPGPTP